MVEKIKMVAIEVQLKLNLFSYVCHITSRALILIVVTILTFFDYILRIPLLEKNGKVGLIQKVENPNPFPSVIKF